MSGCIELYLRYCVIYNKYQYNIIKYNIHIPWPLDLPGVSSQRPLVIEDDRGKTYCITSNLRKCFWLHLFPLWLLEYEPQLQVGTTWLYTLQTETHGQESKWWLFDGWLMGCLIASLDSDPQLHIFHFFTTTCLHDTMEPMMWSIHLLASYSSYCMFDFYSLNRWVNSPVSRLICSCFSIFSVGTTNKPYRKGPEPYYLG